VAQIVVVEDEAELAAAIAARLRSDGHVVTIAEDGPAAMTLVNSTRPDAVVLDLMLPGFDGLEVCRRIQRDRPVPVIMLTARGSETDLVVGLEVGADDYLSKPFSMRELTARVRALLRRAERSATDPDRVLRAGNFEIDVSRRRAKLDGQIVGLTATEFDLLVYLLATPGVVRTREDLLAEVWGGRRDLLVAVIRRPFHELRTPIAALRARLENLADGVEALDGEAVGTMLKATQRLSKLVDQLLQLSQFESGAIGLHRQDFCVRDVVEDAVAEVRPVNVEVRIVTQVKDGLVGVGDPSRIHEVLTNLLTNAVRHSQPGTRVVIEGAPTDEGVRIEVSDEGSASASTSRRTAASRASPPRSRWSRPPLACY
jgi:DNA-binding response OmpR family regulator